MAIAGSCSVVDERTIAFPNYDGNGTYLSMGNLLRNPQVGILFVDWERQKRLRVNGTASIDEDDPLLAEYPEAQFVVRVRATRGAAELSALHPPDGAGGAVALRPAGRGGDARARLEAGAWSRDALPAGDPARDAPPLE